MNGLELRRVGHRFVEASQGVSALDDVSFTVASGEIVAVVGESGCGKTTLGRIVAGLTQPTHGHVIFDGSDVWHMGRRDRLTYRRAVQLVHQDPYASLNPALSIGETLGAAIRHHGVVPRRDVHGEMLRLLDLVGLDASAAFLRRFPHQLSGGQRQRLAIARSVSLHPSLVVADEAVSMMDVSIRVSILNLMLEIQRKESLSYLFISHDLGVVRYFAHEGRIVVIFYGRIIEEGRTTDVIAAPRHPYTWLLLNALPLPDPRLARERRMEDGADTQFSEGPPAESGCIYANRCPFVVPACREEQPEFVEVGPGHRVACTLTNSLRLPDLRRVSVLDEPTAPRLEIAP